MKTIVFEGYLKDLYPDGIKLEADTAAEAILGLQNYPGFRKSDEVLHTVKLPDFGSRDALYAPTLREEILVVPVIEGAGGGNGGILKIILGVVLIIAAAVALFFGQPQLAIGLLLAGISSIAGGIMEMMMKTPKAASIAADEKSKYIPANKNTVKIGTPIPLLYGRRKVWGHFLSFDVDAKDVGKNTTPDEPNPLPPGPAPAVGPAIITAVNPYNAVYAMFKPK